MAVALKRSSGVLPGECGYGCCTTVYGKHAKPIRRRVKRASERLALSDALREYEQDDDGIDESDDGYWASLVDDE